jgi:hypothetical protein
VARFDYWRWHFILTCQVCGSLDTVTTLWETEDGKIAAVLNFMMKVIWKSAAGQRLPLV